MAQRATDRKKREREEAKPILDAFAAVVDTTSPTALSAFLMPYSSPTATAQTTSSNDAASCTSNAVLPPDSDNASPTTSSFERNYHAITFEGIKRLCEALHVAPIDLKGMLLAYCPRAVIFEKASRKEVASPTEASGATPLSSEPKLRRYDDLPWSTNVGDLCFVILGACAPTEVRERRRLDSNGDVLAALTPGPAAATDVPPLVRHFRNLFATHFDEEVATDFFKTVSQPLPMALRLHRTDDALREAAIHFLHRRRAEDNGLRSIVKPVSWLGEEDQSTTNESSKFVCESYSCSHADYHANPAIMAVCKTLHSSGALSFQELVSVLPVLGLGIKGNHRVLDMCAAPGSKTLLAVDMASVEAGGKPLGLIWANEKDHPKAMQTLPARMKRHHAPNIVTTKCDATQLPMLFRSDPSAEQGVSSVRFDRIICDVPCSGDGTIRKERSLIGTWNERYIDSLVPTQIKLLRRGLELLEEGGILAYSTCSLNPKEDEEVIFEVMKNYAPSSMELLSVREALLYTYGGALPLDTFASGNGIRVTPTAPCSEDPKFRGHRAQDLPILADNIANAVLRVLPQTHNTGGFFVALIKKITHTSPAAQLPPNVASKLNHWTGHKRFKPLAIAEGEADAPMWFQICDFYGIPVSHTSNHHSASATLPYFYQLVPMAYLNPDGNGPTKRIQMLSPLAADWATKVRPYKGPGIDFVLGGVRAFEIYDGTYLSNAECRWRVVSEASSIVAEVATKRKMLFDLDIATDQVKATLKQLFLDGYLLLLENGGEDGDQPRAIPMHPSVEALFEPFLNKTADQWRVGGLMIGVRGGLRAFEDAATFNPPPSSTWWLSATLSGKKLELSVDISCRAFGLTAYFNMVDPFAGGKGPVAESPQADE